MATPEPLAELPKQITDLTGMIPKVGRSFTSCSVDRWFKEPGVSEINYLRNVVANWHISFTKTGTSTIFFIFRRQKETWVMLDARVSLNIRVASPVETQPAPSIQDIQRLVRFPSFLWTDFSDNDLVLFGPPGATRQNTVFFRLGSSGQNILSIMDPQLGKKAKLRYSPRGIPGPTQPQDGKYSIAQFLDLTWTIRDWLAQGKPAAKAVRLIGTPTQDTPVHKILTTLLQAYVDSNLVLIPAEPPPDLEEPSITPDPRAVFQKYLIGSYEVALKLRLKADGSLAEKKEEEQFQLVIDARITAGPPSLASVIVEAPDFLIDGPLFDAFFSSLQPPSAVEAVADRLNLNSGFVRPFLASAKPGAVIFRTSRDDNRDQDTIVLSGELTGSPSIILISGSFKVNTAKDPPSVELDEDSVDARRFPAANPDAVLIGFNVISYYLVLASSIRRWLGALVEW